MNDFFITVVLLLVLCNMYRAHFLANQLCVAKRSADHHNTFHLLQTSNLFKSYAHRVILDRAASLAFWLPHSWITTGFLLFIITSATTEQPVTQLQLTACAITTSSAIACLFIRNFNPAWLEHWMLTMVLTHYQIEYDSLIENIDLAIDKAISNADNAVVRAEEESNIINLFSMERLIAGKISATEAKLARYLPASTN